MDREILAQSGAPTTSEERETRPCRSCRATGAVIEDVSYDASSGELVQALTDCPICGGDGSVSVFLYGPRRA